MSSENGQGPPREDGIDRVRAAFANAEEVAPLPGMGNVKNLAEERHKRRSRAHELFERFVPAVEIEPNLDPEYLVKGWLIPKSLSVVYGQPNVGKSFFALDLAHAIARGRPWGSCRVRKSLVVYVTMEGGAGFDMRVKALGDPCFWVLPITLSFMDPRRDPTFLAEAVNMLAKTHGPCGLIVIDTLARAMPGGDENASQDMGKLVASAETLKERTGAHVMLIHHAGKNAALGARGHSSLRAAIDTEIEITKEEGQDIIEAKATKQRDMQAGSTFRYRLRQVILGQDRDGDEVTTCVVERAAEGEEPRRATVKGKAELALQALQTATEKHGVTRQGSDYPQCRSVTTEQWKEACELHGLYENVSPASERKTFSQAKEALLKKGLVRCFGDVWWLA